MTSKNDGFTLARHHHASSSRKKVNLGVGVCRRCGSEGGHAINGENGNDKRTFKKGPWTAEEDALLMEYVKKHGERHWNCVQKTGLMRCGKSCRLRWTNHLRPDLKKGAFTPQEERIVLELHTKLGNKWSKIAAELPGRTDNEVKNFWNTKIKRKMKVSHLTLNFEENHPKEGNSYHEHLQTKKSLNGPMQQDNTSIPNSIFNLHSSLSSLTPTSIPISPSICKPPEQEQIGSNLISTQNNDPILSFLNNPAYKFQFLTEENERHYDNGNFSTPLSHVPPYVLSTNASITDSILDNHSHPHSLPLDAGSSNTTFVGNLSCPTSSTCKKLELASSQANYQHLPTTPTSKMVTAGYDINDSWISSPLAKNSEVEKSSITEEEKYMIEGTLADEGGEMATISRDNNISNARQMDIHNYVFSYNGVKKSKHEQLEDLLPMDDDLSSLLYDFSTIGTPPPLYHAIDDVSMSMINNDKEASCAPFTTATTLPATNSISEFNFNANNH